MVLKTSTPKKNGRGGRGSAPPGAVSERLAGAMGPPGAGSEYFAGSAAPPWAGSKYFAGVTAPPGQTPAPGGHWYEPSMIVLTY